jgi:hypothetical protein
MHHREMGRVEVKKIYPDLRTNVLSIEDASGGPLARGEWVSSKLRSFPVFLYSLQALSIERLERQG